MRPRLLLVLVTLAALLAGPSAVLAHAELASATPGPGDEVVGSPDEIVATFTQDLDMSRTAMEVRNAAGETVAEGPVRGDGPREIRLALPDLPPGEYEVRWTSFSAEDNELERGRYTFTVLPAPSPTPAPTPSPTAAVTAAPPTVAPATPTVAPPTATVPPTTPDDGGVAALLPIGIAAIVLLGIGAWLLRRR
jgi:methionine-rich copper-binding protein CopC